MKVNDPKLVNAFTAGYINATAKEPTAMETRTKPGGEFWQNNRRLTAMEKQGLKPLPKNWRGMGNKPDEC